MSQYKECKAETGSESSAGYGCGCRKRTVLLEGDINYINRDRSVENGNAKQAKKGCEEVNSITTTQLTSIAAPTPCVTAIVCPPNS